MRRDDDPSVWVRTEQTEEIRHAVDAAGLTLVVGAWGTGKTTLARMLASDARGGRTVLTPNMRGRDFDEVERQVRGELGQGRPGDLVILDGLDELRSAPSMDRLMRLARGLWLGHAHVVALSRTPPEGADGVFQDPEHASSASRSYGLFHLTWSYEDVTRALGASTEIDKRDAAALLALLQWYAQNPEAEQSLLAAAQDQISGDRSGTPDLLFVPDRNGKLRVLPSTALGTADLELVPGRAITATPRITYRATRGFWLPEAAELEQLINDPAVRESDLQTFFEDHPHLLAGTSYDRVVPHPILARDQDGPLIPDFMLEPTEGGFSDVLDLKLPRVPVVAGKKDRVRYTAHVAEALAQVREYRSYFDDLASRQAVQDRYGLRAYRPTVAVVIGRDPSPGRDPLELKRLWDELPGHVKLMTYDDVLRQVRRLGPF